MTQSLPNSFDGMIESKYMKKDDVETPKTLTVSAFTRENVAQKGEPDEHKWIMHFHEEGMKPMVLNPTNVQLLKLALGVNSPAEAVGRKVTVFNDPTVSFAGKLTGGVRIRAAAATGVADFDDFGGIDGADALNKEQEMRDAAINGMDSLKLARAALPEVFKNALRPKLAAFKGAANKSDAAPKGDAFEGDL